MTLSTFLRLGRVSNLPTVWTNAIAGSVLASGGAPSLGTVILVGVILTLFYEGGMWLNDAFDAEIDAMERSGRPIPEGEVSVQFVFIGGFAMLGAGILLSMLLDGPAVYAAVLLALAIVLYDWLHKRTILSPVFMGATRFFSYVLAGVFAFTAPLFLGALGLFAYIIGLTFAAKQEAYDRLAATWPLAVLAIPLIYAFVSAEGVLGYALWVGLAAVVAFALFHLFRRQKGDVPKAVVTMIAGISLYDAVLVAGQGQMGLAFICAAGFFFTLYLQRIASGT